MTTYSWRCPECSKATPHTSAGKHTDDAGRTYQAHECTICKTWTKVYMQDDGADFQDNLEADEDESSEKSSRFRVISDYRKHEPAGSNAGPEQGGTMKSHDRVLVGMAIRCDEGDIDALVLGGKKLNAETGELSDHVEVHSRGKNVDVSIKGDNDEHIITGVWARAHYGKVQEVFLYYRDIREDGTLSSVRSPLIFPRGSGRYDATHPYDGLEAKAILPLPYVLTSVGIGVKAKESQKMRDLWIDLGYIEVR